MQADGVHACWLRLEDRKEVRNKSLSLGFFVWTEPIRSSNGESGGDRGEIVKWERGRWSSEIWSWKREESSAVGRARGSSEWGAEGSASFYRGERGSIEERIAEFAQDLRAETKAAPNLQCLGEISCEFLGVRRSEVRDFWI
ncbi:hypothetical protein MA16_Dca014920 [Dendrobium catenatum]|uniref:Uncharacterized protein n=1 Tax=Dendrobium catenatum TaxID=906689 RepID=A0A2I0WSL0_9ASPA|nr:hypothetical protein MA16_Dca014920 [Dendrobium catenatum]